MKNILKIIPIICPMVLFCSLAYANLFRLNSFGYHKNLIRKNLLECQIYIHGNDSEVINRIMDKLYRLPEVKEKDAFIDSLTKHKHGISMRIMQRPGKLTKYYWIAVGYNSNLRFQTYYNFYVWPDSMVIKYLDPDSGKILTLSEWREIQKSN